MADLEVPLAQIEDLAQQARERIEESIARLGGDSAAFWYAVALIYRRGLADPALARAESIAGTHCACPSSAELVASPEMAPKNGQPLANSSECLEFML
ncbi:MULTISPECIES: hypothetical protein [unclassified Methylobacterium]|uniref:hypothetical protein n=1 Tax=unclassified Methylobacterium TaxID=2615210 RepID=UPI00123791C8|nr:MULTISPECIES: hypothetical protein [Methylobacterium]WFT81232.1 hypothetical protein QA634_04840 [Methylobacterium nodulans]